MPDMLALTLVFWNVHQPRRVGVGVAFVFGLLMDVHQGALLGQHALAYTLLSFFAITIHRRLLWFSVPSQALQVLPLFVAAHAVALIVRVSAGGMFPGWSLMFAPLIEALLWLPASVILLAPQRRPPDPDENRPL
jgi:rod shape-determining protein MreD